MPQTAEIPFYFDFEKVSETLLAIVVLSMFIERSLAVIFESRLFLEKVRFNIERQTRTERTEDGTAQVTNEIIRILPRAKGIQELIAFAMAVLVCHLWKFDAFSTVFTASGGNPTLLGEILTALVIAAGCKGSNKLFRDWMGIASAAQTEVEEYWFNSRKAQQMLKARENIDQNPTKIIPVWEFANTMLLDYYQKNLAQVKSVYKVILSCMVVGFLLIVAAIFSTTFGIVDSDFRPIALWSGIISEFIGATFLFLYRSTMSQALEYTKSLERMNNVGMALQIVDSIVGTEANTEKLEQVKMDISRELVSAANRK